MSTRRNSPARRALESAVDAYARLRDAGVPAVVTADEAYRMSAGVVGRQGDHHSPVSLSALVLAAPAAQSLADALEAATE